MGDVLVGVLFPTADADLGTPGAWLAGLIVVGWLIRQLGRE